MDRLKSLTPDTTNNLKEIFSKTYNLRSNDYVITMGEDGKTAEIAITCTKSMDARPLLVVDEDGFKAFLNLYPPINDGRLVDVPDVFDELATEGIRVNINQEAIADAVKRMRTGEIVEQVLIAEGIRPINGKDAEVEVHFGKADMKPRITEDGRVDYKNIDNIVRVTKGDKLITKKPATAGVRGVTVKNIEVFPTPGADINIRLDGGVVVNPAGTAYTAGVDGYVEYAENILGVYPVYTINGDVDYSTGNIKFNGIVHVKGDVLSGFKIEADKDIIIEGICQDAELRARGDIAVKTGVKGNNNAIIHARRDMIVGYVEKGRLHVRGDLDIRKYAFNSELFVGGKLYALAGEGVIAGGIIKVCQEMLVKQIGTQGNSRFTVQLGMKYYIEQEIDKIKQEREKLDAIVEQINDVFGKFDFKRKDVTNNPKIQKLMAMKEQFGKTRELMLAKEELLAKEARADGPKLKARGAVYEGVSVKMFGSVHIVKNSLEQMVFFYDKKYHEVMAISLKDEHSIELNQGDDED